MNYVILGLALWVLFFGGAIFIVYKKYGSLKNAAFIRGFRVVGMICIFFVFVIMVIIKAFP